MRQRRERQCGTGPASVPSFSFPKRRMRGALLGFAALALSAATAAAADPQQSIAEKAQICATCHGEKGVPVDPAYPVIWGQHQGYLYLQLRDFKLGARHNELMDAVVATLQREDLMPLAEYFSKQPWPRLDQKAASDADSGAARRVNVAIGCTGCHLGEYQGDATVARLAGQNHDYLLKSMRDFRSGARANNPGMTDLMKAASDADLAAMANFLAGH
jgi:cytochrome c553